MTAAQTFVAQTLGHEFTFHLGGYGCAEGAAGVYLDMTDSNCEQLCSSACLLTVLTLAKCCTCVWPDLVRCHGARKFAGKVVQTEGVATIPLFILGAASWQKPASQSWNPAP